MLLQEAKPQVAAYNKAQLRFARPCRPTKCSTDVARKLHPSLSIALLHAPLIFIKVSAHCRSKIGEMTHSWYTQSVHNKQRVTDRQYECRTDSESDRLTVRVINR